MGWSATATAGQAGQAGAGGALGRPGGPLALRWRTWELWGAGCVGFRAGGGGHPWSWCPGGRGWLDANLHSARLALGQTRHLLAPPFPYCDREKTITPSSEGYANIYRENNLQKYLLQHWGRVPVRDILHRSLYFRYHSVSVLL